MSSNDERPESLAAQAASWVPPWERPHREPDRAYQAAAEEAARAEAERAVEPESASAVEPEPVTKPQSADEPEPELAAEPELVAEPGSVDEPEPAAELDPTAEPQPAAPVASLDADADADEAQPESAPGTVDTPHGDEPVGEPTDVRVGPELPLPDAIEEAVEAPAEESGIPVDAPLPDGDDAGDVFDAAADDDVSDDDEVDLPFTEEVPEADPTEETTEETAEETTEETTVRATVPAQARGEVNGDAAVERVVDRTNEDLPGLMDDADFAAALEAILLVVDEPVAEMQLAQILEQPTERVATMLEDISARYTAAGHGFDLRRAAGGWRLYTRPEFAPYVERFVLDGQSVRLTQAALETLAVVAYKQPVTRSRISAIRGVNCDGVMRTLVTRGLIEECGTEGETGAYLYRTTPLFLEKLGLNSVDQLPPLAPFLPDDVEEVLDASG